MKKILIFVALVMALSLVAGCYNTDKKDTTATETNSVEIKDFAFNPATINIKAGTVVTWTNKDAAKHTVKLDEIESPSLAKGQSWSYSFTTPGTYNYICGLHPSMQGKIIVE